MYISVSPFFQTFSSITKQELQFYWHFSTTNLKCQRLRTKTEVAPLAKNKFKQPNTAKQPNLAALQPSKAELEQPLGFIDFFEILEKWLTRIQIKLLALFGF